MRVITSTFIAVVAAAVLAGGALAAPASPPRIVHGAVFPPRPKTLKRGTKVKPSQLGVRMFLNGSYGVALASGREAQYPAQTRDGGRTWRTDGPALHVNAAQAPLAVISMGAASRKLQYAYGGGQVVDVTRDGGRTWRSALFDGTAMAVVPGVRGHLVAFIDGSASSGGAKGPTWQYVTRDGGRTWHYTTAVGGG